MKMYTNLAWINFTLKKALENYLSGARGGKKKRGATVTVRNERVFGASWWKIGLLNGALGKWFSRYFPPPSREFSYKKYFFRLNPPPPRLRNVQRCTRKFVWKKLALALLREKSSFRLKNHVVGVNNFFAVIYVYRGEGRGGGRERATSSCLSRMRKKIPRWFAVTCADSLYCEPARAHDYSWARCCGVL